MNVISYPKQNLKDYFAERSGQSKRMLEEYGFKQFNHNLKRLLDDLNREMEGVLNFDFDNVERDTEQIVLSCYSKEHSTTIFMKLNLELDNNMRSIGFQIEPLDQNNYDSTIYYPGMSDQEESLKRAMVTYVADAITLDNAKKTLDKHIKIANGSLADCKQG